MRARQHRRVERCITGADDGQRPDEPLGIRLGGDRDRAGGGGWRRGAGDGTPGRRGHPYRRTTSWCGWQRRDGDRARTHTQPPASVQVGVRFAFLRTSAAAARWSSVFGRPVRPRAARALPGRESWSGYATLRRRGLLRRRMERSGAIEHRHRTPRRERGHAAVAARSRAQLSRDAGYRGGDSDRSSTERRDRGRVRPPSSNSMRDHAAGEAGEGRRQRRHSVSSRNQRTPSRCR